MIFRVIEKAELKALFDIVSAENRVIGPVEVGRDRDNQAIYGFGDVTDFNRIALGYAMTSLPAKRYFLPYKEDMATFRIDGRDWQKTVDYNIDAPFVFFGMHACDINALNKLDKVLMGSVYPMPYYAAKRQNAFIIGIDCEPQPYCFCRSMGADTVLHGFDMFITDLGDHYFVEIQSDTAYNFIRKIKSAEPVEADHARYMQIGAEKNKKFRTSVDTTDLTKILDMEFQSDVWKYWGDKCLSCGTCAHVCPTCYCYSIEESVAPDLQKATKTKILYSCNFIDFAQVAGGHNFRPERSSRLKYRYYHKHRGFVEAYEESLCVGCGRCGESCLADITVPEVISSVRGGTVQDGK
ncbi:MAG: 4Fe-4S dicluster domain-containing protein [Thermodesulfovibrionales bacterium]